MPHLRPLSRLTLLAAVLLAGCSQYRTHEPVEVNIVALNDFHGYIESGNLTYLDAGGQPQKMKAGGIAAISGLLAEMRKRDPELLFVGVGDLVGGSPPISSMWADEPSLRAMDMMGMRLSAVGNHELDMGRAEFMRQIQGGCDSPRPDKACQFEPDYAGIQFPYLAANLVNSQTGKPLFPAYHVEEVHGVKVGFVGAVLESVDTMISRDAMAGMKTLDEADAINAQVPELLAQGVQAIVAVVHQGGTTPETNEQPPCTDLRGDIATIAKRLDPHIKVMLSAHSHQRYLCQVGDVLVSQAGAHGKLMTHVKLLVDPKGEQPLAVEAENVVVDPARFRADPAVAALAEKVAERSQAMLRKPVARLGATEISRQANTDGESPMGNLIADAQLAATLPLGAQVAFMNMGGIRDGMTLEPAQREVTYAQVAGIQPFNNGLTLLTLTGRQLRALLEQQWRGESFNPLQPSASLRYRWDPARPAGQRVIPGSVMLNGAPIRDNASYRVTVNSFMADGGDGLTVLTEGSNRLDTGLNDLEALITYLQASDQAGKPAGRAQADGRIRRVSGMASGAR